MDINIAVISGYVKGAPRIFGADKPVASFTVACGKGKTKDGENLGYDYVNVKAFGGTADYVNQNLKDSDYVTVYGRNTSSNYTNKNGDKVYAQEITALNIKSNHPQQKRAGDNANYDAYDWGN